jgi:hypothetical protein
LTSLSFAGGFTDNYEFALQTLRAIHL